MLYKKESDYSEVQVLCLINRDLMDKDLKCKQKIFRVIHKYNPMINFWDTISKMPTSRILCQVVVLHENEIVVVGGHTGMFYTTTDKVETASVTLKD